MEEGAERMKEPDKGVECSVASSENQTFHPAGMLLKLEGK